MRSQTDPSRHMSGLTHSKDKALKQSLLVMTRESVAAGQSVCVDVSGLWQCVCALRPTVFRGGRAGEKQLAERPQALRVCAAVRATDGVSCSRLFTRLSRGPNLLLFWRFLKHSGGRSFIAVQFFLYFWKFLAASSDCPLIEGGN